MHCHVFETFRADPRLECVYQIRIYFSGVNPAARSGQCGPDSKVVSLAGADVGDGTRRLRTQQCLNPLCFFPGAAGVRVRAAYRLTERAAEPARKRARRQ